ncbi:hypothetical protein J6590_037824 [Homalodisca vitripennis]|nr:hypothetical protein J6590_037824 [Homalodisca vitripennis]
MPEQRPPSNQNGTKRSRDTRLEVFEILRAFWWHLPTQGKTLHPIFYATKYVPRLMTFNNPFNQGLRIVPWILVVRFTTSGRNYISIYVAALNVPKHVAYSNTLNQSLRIVPWILVVRFATSGRNYISIYDATYVPKHVPYNNSPLISPVELFPGLFYYHWEKPNFLSIRLHHSVISRDFDMEVLAIS